MDRIQAIILAGGKGTRLSPLTDNVPKPLVPILGKHMIRYVLEHLQRHGVTNVAISTAHLGHMIEEALGDGAELGMQISYLREPEPMGTGGWAKLVDWSRLDDRFLVVNADNLFWIDLEKFLARHAEVGGAATIAAMEIPSETAINYELLATDAERTRLTGYIDRKDAEPLRQAGPTVFINTGWYVMSPDVAKHIPDVLPLSNEVHIWPALAASGLPMGLYHATEPWFDSGTHERLARVEKFLNENPGYAS